MSPTLTSVSYPDFVLTVPAWLRLLLAVLVTVGITVGLVALLHRRILELNDESGSDESEPRAPEMYYLSGRILSVTTMAFVFLLAFALGNLWSNHRAAEAATQAEIGDLTRVAAAAAYLPTSQGGPIATAVENYAASVREVQWPLMQAGDVTGTAAVQTEASAALVEASAAAVAQGAADSPAWSALSSALDDALTNGSNRVAQVPTGRVLSIVLLVCALGIVNLAMIAVFQPARLRYHLFLIGVMATVTATLLFVLIESSNPYLGGGAVDPALYAPTSAAVSTPASEPASPPK